MLKYSPANAKIKALRKIANLQWFLKNRRKVYSLDLSSGWSCPGAKDCKSRAVERIDAPGRFTIQDGPDCEFRCFSASQEAQYPDTRNLRGHNFDLLTKVRGFRNIAKLLLASLPKDAGIIRYHVGGDFFKREYLKAAIEVAKSRPDVLFYAYTKSLHYLKGLAIPPNFRLTVSRGGKYDHLIGLLGIREAVVVKSVEEAQSLGLEIDHDDSHAATAGGSFALLIHGTQPAGSDASKALRKLKGKGSYAR